MAGRHQHDTGFETSGRLLKESGLRKTVGRVKIIEALMAEDRPLAGAELITILGRDAMDPASVYRVLSAFAEREIVHRVEGADSVARFALNRGPGNHAHFRCRSCGKMDCLPGVPVPHLDVRREGYVIEEESLYLSGLCARCNKGRNG